MCLSLENSAALTCRRQWKCPAKARGRPFTLFGSRKVTWLLTLHRMSYAKLEWNRRWLELLWTPELELGTERMEHVVLGLWTLDCGLWTSEEKVEGFPPHFPRSYLLQGART